LRRSYRYENDRDQKRNYVSHVFENIRDSVKAQNGRCKRSAPAALG
jgi:hypothetical protein